MSPVAINGVDKQGVDINGVQVKQSLSDANETVNKGVYNPTTLSTVDTDLATGNIKNGITIFGFAGSADVFDISDATAVEAEVLAPETFYAVAGGIRTGTMPTQTLNPANENVPAGYYAATTLSAVDAQLAAANIKSGINIFGFTGPNTVQEIGAANATVAQVLAPNTFFAVSGTIKTGTMGDYSAAGITIVPSPSKQNLPAAGYWLTTDASVRVLGSAYLIGANIKSGVTIFGVTGTYDFSASPIAAARMRMNDEGWVNGAKITGSGTVTLIADNTAYPAGYHVGAANLAAIDADLAVGNIKTGVNIFGYVGTYDTTASAPTAAQVILNKVAWANGAQITGTMPTQAIASGSNNYLAGYHAGNAGGLSAIEATLAVGNIKSGVNIFGFVGLATVQDISAANAAVTDVLNPKTFFSVTGPIKTGTMATVALLADNTAYPAGYHAGAANLQAVDADLAVGNIKTGVNIFGYVGTYDTSATPIAATRMKTGDEGWVNGAKITGTGTKTLSDANDTVAEGYYAATTLHAVDGDLAVGNIKSGVTVFGFLGTYAPTMTVTEQWSPLDRDSTSSSWETKDSVVIPSTQKIVVWIGNVRDAGVYEAYGQVLVDSVQKLYQHGKADHALLPVQYAGDGGTVLFQLKAEAGGHTYGSRGMYSVSV